MNTFQTIDTVNNYSVENGAVGVDAAAGMWDE
jgi:hypothetical protein